MDSQNTTEEPRRRLYQEGDPKVHPVAKCAGDAASPAVSGYVSSENLSFSDALNRLRAGRRIARRGWNGRGQYIELQVPDKNSKMTLPYIFIRTVQGDLVPWLASQTDLLAFDWLEVTERTILVYGDERNASPASLLR